MDTSLAKILIIDDHSLIRHGLRAALERAGYTEIQEAASKNEALATIAHKPPDIIVVDLNLPDGSGLEIIHWVRKISHSIGIVVLTMSEEDAHLLAALQAGASAYVLKTAPLQEVVQAVTQSFIAPRAFSAHGLRAAIDGKDRSFGLTSRELQVLSLLQKGSSSSNIAMQLFVSEATVKTHLSHIYRKLGVENRTEAVSFAIGKGLI